MRKSFKAIIFSLLFLGVSTTSTTLFAKYVPPGQSDSIYDICFQLQMQQQWQQQQNGDPAVYCQSCQSPIVNTLKSTGGTCTTAADGCGLDGAISRANTCGKPSTITFDSSLDNKVIDLNAAGFNAPLKLSGKNITVDGNRLISVKAVAGKAAFVLKGENNKIKGIHITDATVSPIEIDATAKNADFLNVSSVAGVALVTNNAADLSDSNIPVMVVPGTGGDYVVVAIVLNDAEPEASKLRFCETSDATTGDCTTAAVTVSQTKTHQVIDPNGVTSGSKIMVEYTLGGTDQNKSYMVFVKNTDKSVAVAVLKPSLSPLFKDSDNDGLSDSAETTWFNTDPNKLDSNGDGYSDIYNVIGSGTPGQKYVSISGTDLIPYANENGFVPANLIADPGTTSAGTSDSPPSSGCSIGGAASAAPQVNALLAGLGLSGLGLLRGLRSRAKKK